MTPTEQQIRAVTEAWLVLREASRALRFVVEGRAPTLNETNEAARVADRIERMVR